MNALAIEHFILRHPSESKQVSKARVYDNTNVLNQNIALKF